VCVYEMEVRVCVSVLEVCVYVCPQWRYVCETCRRVSVYVS